MIETIKELNKVTKKTFGKENNVSVARCPAFGHDDCCVIFSGPKSGIAARLFATKVGSPKIEDSVSEFMGITTKSTTVVYA